MTDAAGAASRAALAFERRHDGSLVVHMGGEWLMKYGVPASAALADEIQRQPPQRLILDAGQLRDWDSAALTFLNRVIELAGQHHFELQRDSLPEGMRRLLALADAVPEKADARSVDKPQGILERIGRKTLASRAAAVDLLRFVGEASIAVVRMLTWRARYRGSDLLVHIQQAGVEALPIVTLISFLVGLILAFVGAVQLQQFGASIFVANLVGIAMVREMGAMMTAIVMAGRTGASYAAQLGSMKVTQEIDALTTMGISPLEFLVLPRLVALFLMMPLLCLYSDLLGILGGAVVGVGMLDLSATTYFQQTQSALRMADLVGGVFKASVYGVLIALAGCLRGMQCGNSSSAVGEATTTAVVTSIVWIISACGIFAVLFYIVGI